MRIRSIILTVLTVFTLPMAAQIFNFSLRTNNQQLIDEALAGAFVKVNQSYELCDTVSNEHFGRNGKDYFSIVPFIGVETECGLIYPKTAMRPWEVDQDFYKYREKYRPQITKSTVRLLNINGETASQEILPSISGEDISDCLCAFSPDTTRNIQGLKVDSLPGVKNGWLIWMSADDLTNTDSVRFTSIRKEIEVHKEGDCLRIDNPEIAETVYGGVYVTPLQTSVGQLTFALTGIVVSDENGWVMDFPFIKTTAETHALTRINGKTNEEKPTKRKKK